MPRYENFLPTLTNIFRTKEKSPKQTQREFNLERLDAWFEYIDSEFLKERQANERTQLNARHIFQSPKPERQEYIVKHTDLDEFCATFKLPKSDVLKLSEGVIPELNGWIRPNRLESTFTGKPYQAPKQPNPIYDERHVKNEKAQTERVRKENPHYVMLPPQQPPVQFVPSSSK